MALDFEAFVVAQYAPLRRVAFLLCGDRDRADDLVQATFAKAHVRWARVGGAADPVAYVHRILINTSRSWLARRWLGELPTGSLPEGAGDDLTAAVDVQLTVLVALRELPRAQREAVVVRHLLGLSEAQAAVVLDVPVGTVKSRTSRAIDALRADRRLVGLLMTTEEELA